jgi:hypothetical protein
LERLKQLGLSELDFIGVQQRCRTLLIFHPRQQSLIGRAQTSEAVGALYHPRYGAISLVWGWAGDPGNDWKGGFGLAHILAKHNRVLNSHEQEST